MFIGTLILITRVYCGFKIIWWLALQNWSTEHPISEIQPVLVYVLLDTWISSVSSYMEKQNDSFD